LREKLSTEKPIYIHKIRQLDVQAKKEKACWIKHHFDGVIVFPLIVRGDLLGFVSFAWLYEHPNWDSKDIDLLSTVAQVISAAIQRERSDKAQIENAAKIEMVLTKTIEALSLTVEKRDSYTAGHQKRVAKLALAIAEKMELSPLVSKGIKLGALIHDIGKAGVPLEILNRPMKLTPEEYALVKTHPQNGYDIVKEIDFLWPIKKIILNHHERLNGSGYPNGLKGEEISIECRIVMVADVVEAMTALRPYRYALPLEVAFDEIRKGAGILYDSDVVDVCIKLFEKDRFKFS